MASQAETQIAIWAQRALRSKLHLPYFTAEVVEGVDGKVDFSKSLDSITAKPLCGRQLNNHSAQRAQLSDRLEFAGSVEEFTYQLLGRKACRHCAIKAGLLVRTVEVEEDSE